MKIEESKKIRDSSFKRRWALRKSKGHDYAKEQDVLANFKQVSEILRILNVDVTVPYGVALMYVILKLQRLSNLLFSGKQPKNEPLQDTVDDLLNYIDLMEECLIEEKMLNL